MKPTTVVNLKGHRDDPDYARRVRGPRHAPRRLAPRRLPLASPFRPGPDGTRQEVLEKYRTHLLSRPDLLALLPALHGHRLGCWCAPERCHAEVIAELADETGGP